MIFDMKESKGLFEQTKMNYIIYDEITAKKLEKQIRIYIFKYHIDNIKLYLRYQIIQFKMKWLNFLKIEKI